MNPYAGKRLVIFGCGYVGSAVALDAMAHGAEVTALTRNPASAAVLREQGIEAVVADLAGPAWHEHIAGGPDLVLNCVSSGGGGTDGYRRSYVEGMASIVAWARQRGPAGTLIYTSSTSVYPQGGGVVVAEAAPTDEGTPSERARLLTEAEDVLRAVGAEVCGRWFILRLAGIYGPGRHHFVDQVRSGEASGSGDVHLNLIHRDDIVAAVAACGGAPREVTGGVFNLADDGAAPKSEIVAWLAARLGVPVPRFTGAPPAGRRAATPDRVIANGKARSVLGWAPRYPTFREGCATLLSR